MLPVQRTYQFQGAAPALNVPVFMADLQTLQNNFLTLTPNQLQDVVMNPPLAAINLRCSRTEMQRAFDASAQQSTRRLLGAWQ